jgi:hypothetical protein
MEFFNSADDQILSLNALPGMTKDGSLSFLGAIANDGEQIARVRITTGNSALGPNDVNGGPIDVVVMDDFFYSEPLSVPQPASATLGGIAALCAVGLCRRRRRSTNLTRTSFKTHKLNRTLARSGKSHQPRGASPRF